MNPEKYQFPIKWYEDKEKYHESQYPIDLQSCYDAGTRFAHRLKKISYTAFFSSSSFCFSITI